jgi:hypothetical protein
MDLLVNTLVFVADSALDVLPIVAFLFAFQWFVIGEKMPNGGQIILGFLFVVVGLGLFLEGLEQSLFPLGRMMATQLTHPEFLLDGIQHTLTEFSWEDFYWVYIFAATVGFSTAMAEPALMAVAMKANAVSGGAISVVGLRVAVATGAGIGVALGCLRVISGVPLPYFVAAGYLVVILQTMAAPKEIVPIAYDSGGVTTSTVTVPLVAALGLGLADAVPGRSPLVDGFGLIAITAMLPIISVLAYGQLSVLRDRIAKSKTAGEDSD